MKSYEKQRKAILQSTLVALCLLLLVAACEQRRLNIPVEKLRHEDGTYRGGFVDEGLIQVNVQFTLKDGVVTEASFRHLVGAKPSYHLGNNEEPYRSVVAQYEQVLQYLVGKRLADHLGDLYEPGNIVTLEVDGYSGATIRSAKIISAIRDALNRGVYGY